MPAFLTMIGVISKPDEGHVVEEFFQLFKTPWEYYEKGRHCEVLLVTGDRIPETDAALIIVYGTEQRTLDESEGCGKAEHGMDGFMQWGDVRIPIYGDSLAFPGVAGSVLFRENSGQPIGYETYRGKQRIIRLGYDLFQEISFLLTTGQPAENALSPTLEYHIAMLRQLIVLSGIQLAEIPPVPAGYRFITCLTHDVDFIGIRKHILDHSVWGFLYRATVGSLIDFIRGRTSRKELQKNLWAALSLPGVYIGICPDPWDQFDRCLEIEGGAHSTFFFIPFRKRAGRGFGTGKAKRRAAKYDVSDVGEKIHMLHSIGCEIGVHGIDAWHSADHGRQELQRILDVAEQDKAGIRMHWLCRDENTFALLDQAGYSYDSTMGYNDAVGFKAGTAQPYKPFDATELLEIPLHIQDTALFSRGRLNISVTHADVLCRKIIDNIGIYGGILTVLWHQRSLGPERLWGDYYQELVNRIRNEKVWFVTVGEAADWFRMRRSVTFERSTSEAGTIHITKETLGRNTLPGLVVRQFRKNQNCNKDTIPTPVQLQYDDVVLQAEKSHHFAN